MSKFFLLAIFITVMKTISMSNWIMKETFCKFSLSIVLAQDVNVNVLNTITTHSLLSCSSCCCGLTASSLTYSVSTKACTCFNETSMTFTEDPLKASGLYYGQRKYGLKISEDSMFVRRHVTPERQDCQSLYEEGFTSNGVYTIRPPEGAATDAWCDMENGGWTVISRREDGSEDFNRGWDQYVAGFGTRTGEYWLGLESIHLLTLLNTSVKIYVESFGDVLPTSVNAQYNKFVVNDVFSDYRLEIDGFMGDCGDSMTYHNNMQFTTFDNDNDKNAGNCAVLYPGGYWYKSCHYANPNGLYLGGATDQFGKGMSWFKCWGHYYSPKIYVYKIKRN